MAESGKALFLLCISRHGRPVTEIVDEFIRFFNAGTSDPCNPRWQITVDEWQRYEFLGDRVLNLIVAGYLYNRTPACREGDMTLMMGVVSNESLAAIALRQGIEVTRLIPETMQQQPCGESVRGGAVEALVGALYVTAGFDLTRHFVLLLMKQEIDSFNPRTNYIGRLQEWFQQHGKPLPAYTEDMGRHTGPDHAPRFTFIVRDGETARVLGEGSGRTVTEAKQNAAHNALEILHCE